MATLTAVREVLANMIFPEGVERRNTLERFANTDELTGLGNRRAFEKFCQVDVDQDWILFDLDNFGMVNKAYGQERGDQILAKIGSLIKEIASELGGHAKSFRIGGDEFIVIIDPNWGFNFRDELEMRVGYIHFQNLKYDFNMSISGVVGDSYADASLTLQERKRRRKA